MNNSKFLLTILLLFTTATVNAQANLTIVNNSQRTMTVKVMKKVGSKSISHEKVTISANSSSKIYFSESGNYFTKTKATLKGKTAICKKGNAFKVVNDTTSYSILGLTFTITNINFHCANGRTSVSKCEF